MRTVSVLSDFAVLGAVNHEGRVTGGSELFGVGVVDLERDGFAAEPVACGLLEPVENDREGDVQM
jgi:hypothetical protein